jgi:hypothetical protein
MNSDKVSAGDASMTNANQRTVTSISGSVAIPAVATVLILVGLVFQVSELGYAHVRPDNVWLFSVLASNIWNILSLHMNTSAIQDFLRFWPLLLVSLGFSIMLAARQNRAGSASDNRQRGIHGL